MSLFISSVAVGRARKAARSVVGFAAGILLAVGCGGGQAEEGTGSSGSGAVTTGASSGSATTGGGGASSSAVTGGSGGAGEGGHGGAGGAGHGGAGGGCAQGMKACGGACVPSNDPAFGCAPDACDPCAPAHATAVCAKGACAVGACAAGFGDCDALASNGCETDLTTPLACGACNTPCAAATGCLAVGACDPKTKTCAYTLKPDGAACDDGNACTLSDTCAGGTCTGSSSVTCVAKDACHAVGACNPATGQCSNPSVGDGTACDDGDPCTQGESCQGGVCGSGSKVTCPPIDACHVAGVCNPANGQCIAILAPDGTLCNDGSACTGTDVCVGGACVGVNPVACAPQDLCHAAGACNPATGVCSNPPKPDGAACNDGNACTLIDTCKGGVCVGSTPVACAASDTCHTAGVCNPATGACTSPPKPDATACNDGNPCTQIDACKSGVCVGGNPVVCGAPPLCHGAGTCNPASGQCVYAPASDGTACNDGNACTLIDVCSGGLCLGTVPLSCTASDQCHSVGTCDPVKGACSNPVALNGTACTLGGPGAATCSAGVCTAAMSCAAGTMDCDMSAANGCETSILTAANCGACGHTCPGLGFATDDASCANPAASQCSFTCRGESYDVDGNPGNGCEKQHAGSNHTQGAASARGTLSCSDSVTDQLSGQILSDGRVHANPAVTGFDSFAGSAPDYWSVYASGGLCLDDYYVTFTTSGGGQTSCYTAQIVTNKGTNSLTLNGQGSGWMSGASGSYTDGSTIYFEISKTCSTAVEEAVTYTLSYHL